MLYKKVKIEIFVLSLTFDTGNTSRVQLNLSQLHEGENKRIIEINIIITSSFANLVKVSIRE